MDGVMKEKISLNNLEGEIWEDIPDYDGYMISNYGRVKSQMKRNPIILRKTLASGKFCVKVRKKRGVYINANVGRLVATVFVREPYENEIIIYKDGNVLNDNVNNLKWGRRNETTKNTFLQSHKGTSNGMARLNEDKAREIRKLKSTGKTYRTIAAQYDVSISCIQYVVEQRCWKGI